MNWTPPTPDEVIVNRTKTWVVPIDEWGPDCAGCGGEEFRIDGYCSCECRDFHCDEDIEILAAEIFRLRRALEKAQAAIRELS